jgi:hypothetical protein
VTLPPKAINVLVNLKAELLSKQAPESVIITPKRESKVVMRHARRPNAWQRSCQRRDFFSPIY